MVLPVDVTRLGSFKGLKGDKGAKGDTGTFASVSAVTLPAGSPAYATATGPQSARHLEVGIPRGLPGVNGVDNDEAMAELVAALDSDTGAALYAATGTVALGWFDPAGDGVTDDTATFAAAVAATPDGGTLHLGGKRYRLTSKVDIVGKSITLRGGTIVQGYNGQIITYTGNFGEIFDVTDVVSTPRVIGDGSATRVTKITAPGHDFTWGDVVKVVSDDLLVGARSATARSGEYQIVQEVDGDDVYLSGQLRLIDTYATNVRVARHDKGALHLEDVTFAVDDAGMGVWSAAMVHVYGAMAPMWSNVQVESATGPVIEAWGCYGYRASDWKIRRTLNEAGQGRYGYGLNDRNCEHSTVTGFDIAYARHGWTTNGLSPEEGDTRLFMYGRSAYTVVSDSTAVGCTNAPFDTHEEAYAITFVNCSSRGTVFGNQSSGAGYQVRGKKHRYINCHVADSAVGFAVLSSFAGDTEDPEFINCSTDAVTWASFTFSRASGHSTRIPGVRIIGGTYRSERHFMTGTDAQIYLGGDVLVQPKLNGTNLEGAFHLNDCDVEFDGVTVDFSAATGTNIVLARFQDTAKPGDWRFVARNVKVKAAPSMGALLRSIDGDSGPIDATGHVKLDNILMDVLIAPGGSVTGAEITYTVESTGQSTAVQGNHVFQVTAHARYSQRTGFTDPTFNAGMPGGWQVTCTNQNDEIHWDAVLEKGTYAFRVSCIGGPDKAIITPLLNGPPAPGSSGIDTYQVSEGLRSSTTTIKVPYSGLHRIGIRAMYKNGSSSGYKLAIGMLSLTRIS